MWIKNENDFHNIVLVIKVFPYLEIKGNKGPQNRNESKNDDATYKLYFFDSHTDVFIWLWWLEVFLSLARDQLSKIAISARYQPFHFWPIQRPTSSRKHSTFSETTIPDTKTISSANPHLKTPKTTTRAKSTQTSLIASINTPRIDWWFSSISSTRGEPTSRNDPAGEGTGGPARGTGLRPGPPGRGRAGPEEAGLLPASGAPVGGGERQGQDDGHDQLAAAPRYVLVASGMAVFQPLQAKRDPGSFEHRKRESALRPPPPYSNLIRSYSIYFLNTFPLPSRVLSFLDWGWCLSVLKTRPPSRNTCCCALCNAFGGKKFGRVKSGRIENRFGCCLCIWSFIGCCCFVVFRIVCVR